MALVLVSCTGLAGIAWQNNPSVKALTILQDTLPKDKKERAESDKTIIRGDLDKALEQVKKAKENLQQSLEKTDWEKMHQDLQQSLKKIDAEKLEAEMENAIKSIDAQKIQAKIQAELRQVDWEKMQKVLQKTQAELKSNLEVGKLQAELQHAMEETKKAMAEMKSMDMEKVQQELQKAQEELKKNLDGGKLQAEMQRAMEDSKKAMAEIKLVDMEKMQQELEEAKEDMLESKGRIKQDMDKARKELNETLKKDFKKELEKARVELKQAEKDLQNYKEMLAEMDKDGLLNSHEPYNIEFHNGTLIINGKTQPDSIRNKYRHYFKKEDVKIIKGKAGEEENTIDL